MNTILIAEDDENVRALLSRILRRCGYTVELAHDGGEAISRLEGRDYDALVLDLMMPRVNGVEVINYMIETKPLMVQKTVVVTAFPGTATRNELDAVCQVVPKPFDLKVLLAAIESCVAA
ncbi:MAG: response regulator [Thermoanaerobaculia bacterium]